MAYEYAIETKMLKKIYGEQVAVNNVSLHIPKGHIYGLLGRNGAGKTSIMKLLLRLISATSGEVYIFGQPVINRERRLFKRIGAIIETPGFYSNLTGTENLEIFAKLRGVTKPHAVEHALELVGLPYRDKKLFGEYSLGMKQRLGIANAIMHDPDLLILDEPINGLDPIGITHIDKQPPAETNTHKIKENKDGDYASKNDIIRAIKFIADQLLEEAVLSEDNKDANWLGVKLVGDYGHGSLSIRPLDVYLYEGVAGICIFFAAISRYYSNYESQRVLSAATKSLFDYTEDILQREGNHIDSSGVFGGESSLVYSYSLLYQLTRNPEYLKYAEKHFPIIERAVQYDQAFDVVYGNAGAILALINLYSLKRDKRYLNCAKTAAKVICDAQQKGGGWKAATVSAPLAGFSHGVAGIVYALNKLYKLYPDKHIKQCIVNGLQYEDELFCEADGNWKDIRKGSTNGKNLCAWCHGAGGILLSRISLLGNIDNETDEIVKEDIRNAVKTMQSHKYLQNPCVCHGIAGNAEILLTYGQQFQDQIASSTAKHFYSRLVGSVNSGTFECSRPYLYGFNIPGFMTGLAGIGYSLLRLLDPTLPSVLQINI